MKTLILTLIALALIACASVNAGDAEAVDLRVMSFNIRYAGANDGANAWPRRRAMVVDIIRADAPDLLGLQEVQHIQATFLREQFKDYAFHGVGRDDGKTRGEYAAILYKRDRFEQLDGGHQWLSERPDVPGSVSWDSSMTRMFSWVKLRDRRNGRVVVFINTHFDHRGRRARLESARLIRRFIDGLDRDVAVIATGDFNCSEDDPPYRALLDATADAEGSRPLIDSFRAVHAQRGEGEATFHGFDGRVRGSRIDWIVHDNALTALDASIDRTNVEGRYPSDHYPVTATLRWK